VRQQNTKQLEQVLLDVSSPASSNYGKHLRWEEVNSLVAPSASSVLAVETWLNHHSISEQSHIFTRTPNSDFIRVLVTVEQAELLLNTHYYVFVHNDSGRTLIRAMEYSIPACVFDHIDVIGPSTRFPAIRAPKAHRKPHYKASESSCANGVEPSCLRTLYNVGSYKSTSSNNSMAATGYLEQYISTTDLQSFFSQFDSPNSGRNPTIVGPNDSTNPGVEASLDIQYIMSMGNGVPATFWYTPGRQPNTTEPDNEPYLDFLTALANTSVAPWVISTSYGDNENTVDLSYATRVNTEFMKGGVRGISMLFSSGDGGVSGGQSQQCTVFVPTYPAASPYVTSVGGTTGVPESGVDFSSGGFSNYWTRPTWQTQAVSDYLTKYGKNLPSSKLYNGTYGRGFPDVSAQGTDFTIVIDGFNEPVDGTSCSAPTFSGIVALLNDVRLQAQKTTLGFLNPLFYSNPTSFNDITSGNNPGCGTNGFYASQGWDPVTGLGTPNFSALQKIVLSLP